MRLGKRAHKYYEKSIYVPFCILQDNYSIAKHFIVFAFNVCK